jgi:hypothetical protein
MNFNVILNWVLLNITLRCQYYLILLAYWVIFKSVLLNITYSITQYYIQNHTILPNITCILGNIQINITQYSMDFINITQVILSNTEFNILLRIG